MFTIKEKLQYLVLDKLLSLILMYLPCKITLDGNDVDITFIANRIVKNREKMMVGDIINNDYNLYCSKFGSYTFELSYSDSRIMASIVSLGTSDDLSLKELIYSEVYRALIITKLIKRVEEIEGVIYNVNKKP